jgi:hypothetical protein
LENYFDLPEALGPQEKNQNNFLIFALDPTRPQAGPLLASLNMRGSIKLFWNPPGQGKITKVNCTW